METPGRRTSNIDGSPVLERRATLHEQTAREEGEIGREVEEVGAMNLEISSFSKCMYFNVFFCASISHMPASTSMVTQYFLSCKWLTHIHEIFVRCIISSFF